jgi:DNA invertase Pin-like site-specific DNA recombinase
MPRPTKFNPQRARSALLLVKAGELRQWVARGAGIGRRTLQEWLARGRAGEETFAEWAKAEMQGRPEAAA